MKQFILFITILTSSSLFAQEGTTLEEYRYLSKGYIYQLEMGLDAQKEGYSIKKLFKTSTEAELVGLYQNGKSEPRALLIILDNEKGKANYVCLPNGKADARVKDLAKSDQKKMATDQKTNYQTALNEFLFEALSNPDLKALAYTPMKSNPSNYQKDETLVSRSADLNQFIKDAPELKPKEPEVQMTNAKASKRTIIGEIANRTVLNAEKAIANPQKKGIIAIKICVDSEGNVRTAKFTQRGSTTFDAYLKKVALKAAKSIKFAKLDIAEQCGIINYKF